MTNEVKKMDTKETLIADLIAAREELLAAVDLVPPLERSSRVVCGEWTVRDVLGHVADWELVWIDSLRQLAAGRSPQFEPVESIEAQNQAFFRARRDQSWEEAWADLHTAHAELLQVLQSIDDEDLGRSMTFLLGGKGTVYRWVRTFLEHDREHARELKVVLA
jgi:uncharacterized damage-inducible protein DinB